MMKPRRVCRSSGGMVTGPAAAVVRGHENLTNILTTCSRTWATRHLISTLSCHTTDLTDTALSSRATGSSAARAGLTDLLLQLPHPSFHCRRRRWRCRGSVLTASRVRGQVASGSGATVRWVGSDTGSCPTVDVVTGIEATGVVEPPEVRPVATDLERIT